MQKYFLSFLFLFLMHSLLAQKNKADSMSNLLAKAKTDTDRVNIMWRLASYTYIYDPGKALLISRQALFLAKKIKYEEGESRSLGILASTFFKIGNYTRALEFFFQKLQLDEKSKNSFNLASVLINIGSVYVYQEEYNEALKYYYKSDSIITSQNIDELKYFSMQNLGDVYDRLYNYDSAFMYFSKALIIANSKKDNNFIGASMTGLGHTYFKQNNYTFSLLNYLTAITYLQSANNDELLCEATLGLAALHRKLNNNDSAVYYARYSLAIAKKGAFITRQLDAAEFLSEYYRQKKNIDSAFTYLNEVRVLNDSVNSKSRIRELQVMSSNEQLRQIELEESKRTAQREREQQLQFLFIGIFIPGFFLFTLLLSRIQIHVRVIKILGILSLLILFEYLTLLLHPYVAEITHHTPVYEMLIFVTIAAILIPAHHRIEHWLIEKLIQKRANQVKFKKIKIELKKPEE